MSYLDSGFEFFKELQKAQVDLRPAALIERQFVEGDAPYRRRRAEQLAAQAALDESFRF